MVKSITLLEIFWQVSFFLQPVYLRESISPSNVSPVIRLEIPGCYGNDIVVTDPYFAFKFTAYSAHPCFVISTFYQNVITSQKLDYSTQHLAFLRQLHFL